MLLAGRNEQLRHGKSSKTAQIEEKANNTDDGKPNNRRFETSVNRESHAISCANKRSRNSSSLHLFSPLCSIGFSALHSDCFSVFADENNAVIFARFFTTKNDVFRPFPGCDFLHTNRHSFLGEYWFSKGRIDLIVVPIFLVSALF